MKRSKTYVIILLSILVIPSVVYASWWNPFTWNRNISKFNKVQIITPTQVPQSLPVTKEKRKPNTAQSVIQQIGCHDPASCMKKCIALGFPSACGKLQAIYSGNNVSGNMPSQFSNDSGNPNSNQNNYQANRNWNAPSEGTGGEILYAENLPPCQGTELFTSPPAVDGTYDNIAPLGQTSTPGHTFPVDHMYFNFKHTIPGSYTSPSLPATVLSPGDVEVFQINAINYEQNGKNIGTDYHIHFAPCREVTVYIGHVTSLSTKLQNAIDHADQKSCGATFSTGSPTNTVLKPCSYSLLLNLKSGEEIGIAGGSRAMSYLQAFDFGVHDQRTKSLPFVDPKYWTIQNLHTVCGFYYYTDGPVKSSLLNHLNNVKKDANGFPDCGTNMWDKASTIQGNWVLPNIPSGRVPDMQGLAAIHLNIDPSQGLIDWGSGIAQANRVQFAITNVGLINRDPGDIKADGSIYCFQNTGYSSTFGTAAGSVLLQLIDDNILKAEYLAGTCPSSLAFSNPIIYNR